MQYLLIILFAALLAGCQGKRDLTPDEVELVNQLRTELSATEADVALAEDENSKLTSGFIKGLITARLEVLRTNKALIQQRINAIESGARVTLTVSTYEPDPQEAARLTEEIEILLGEIKSAREDASQHAGGMALAMKHSSIATQEQTLSMLKQRHLVAKYGLSYLPAPRPTTSTLDVGVDSNRGASAKTKPADGPFGLIHGLTKAEVESMAGETATLLPGSTNSYLLTTAPKSHNAFENYVVVIGDLTGLCAVRAIGKDITTSRHGLQAKADFNQMEATLSGLYGAPERTDRLLPGSIWDEPEDWMMGLLKKERFLFAQWQGEDEPLKNELDNIALVIKAKGSDTAYLVLEYTFQNHEQCTEESQAAENGAL